MTTWSRTLDSRAIADELGTPLYVHHLPTLRANFAGWVELVGDPGRVRYPVKANPSPIVVGALAGLGSGADCASRPEVQLALAHGIPLERISYNTPAFEVELGAWLLRNGADVVVDSWEALDALTAAVPVERVGGHLYVRVNPGGLPGYRNRSDLQRFTSHGADTSQFGIASEEIVPGLAASADRPLPVSGLHLHVGTQMDNVETFREGLRFLHHLADLLAAETAHRICAINLGGGLGIPYADDQEFPTVAELVRALRPELREGLIYEVEPGNALVGEASVLLTRVVASKTTRGKRWAIADVGTDQLVKHTVARWEHPILGPDGRPLPGTGADGLAGPLCFAGDVLLPATELGAIATGDVLTVEQAGTYCEAVASRFNGRRAPAQAVIDRDGAAPRLARRREDLFFDPARQSLRLEAQAPGCFTPDAHGEALSGELLAALASSYMHRLAADDGYEIRTARRTGEGSYLFTIEPRASVGFVAMPLALRMIGDATIIAVGREMGWTKKPRPVWATRIAMSCAEIVPIDGPVECAIALSALAPSPQPDVEVVALSHFRLGMGAVTGVAAVTVPAATPVDAAEREEHAS